QITCATCHDPHSAENHHQLRRVSDVELMDGTVVTFGDEGKLCMNCHKGVRTDSSEIQKIANAHESGDPIRWAKVHLLPDYAYFSHQAHVNANVGCASCHGRMDQMEVVRQVEPLSMGWCLECHRNPETHLRPEGVAVTDMEWTADDASIAAARQRLANKEVQPPEHCSACHR
ncbi:MAG: cytochrome c3 family protein, partial [Planctomycetota bacterium]